MLGPTRKTGKKTLKEIREKTKSRRRIPAEGAKEKLIDHEIKKEFTAGLFQSPVFSKPPLKALSYDGKLWHPEDPHQGKINQGAG